MSKHEKRKRFSRQVWLERVANHILQNGLAEFSVRSFAGEYGVSTQALISHFGSRDQLVEEALQETFRGDKLAAERLINDMESIEGLFGALVNLLQEPEFFRRNAIQLELIAAASMEPESHSDFAGRITRRAMSVLEAQLRKEGLAETDVERVASFLVAVSRGIIVNALGGQSPERLRLIADQAMDWYRAQLPQAH